MLILDKFKGNYEFEHAVRTINEEDNNTDDLRLSP